MTPTMHTSGTRPAPPTIFGHLTAAAARLGDQPAVVFTDAGTGERTELSFATLHNWVSKTANLLVDHLDAGLGSVVGVHMPLHWMGPVVCLAAWATGAAVAVEEGGDVVVGHEHDLGRGRADVDLLVGAGMGGRVADGDPGEALVVTDVLAQPDEFVDDPGDEGAWVLGGRSQASVLAEPLPGPRVLHAADRFGEEAVLAVARTLPHGTGLVLARGHDEAGLRHVAEQERVG